DAWYAMQSEMAYGVDFSGAAGTFEDAVGVPELAGFATGYDGANAVWTEPHIIRNDRDTVVIGFRRAFGQYQTFTLHAGDYFVEFYAYRADLTAFSAARHAIGARTAFTTSALSAAAPFSA